VLAAIREMMPYTYVRQEWACQPRRLLRVSGTTPSELPYACPQDANREEFKINCPTRGSEMHCKEPMPSNFASESLGLGDMNFVVTNAAVSSANGATLFPNVGAGEEAFGLGNCASGRHRCVTVQPPSTHWIDMLISLSTVKVP
jgi:hypothetical protein